MNWDAIAAVGQVLGSVAVFITLVYLAIQTNHARREVRRAISQGRADALQGLYRSRAADERLLATRIKGNKALGVSPQLGEFYSALVAGGLTLEEAVAINLDEIASWYARCPALEFVEELSQGQRFEVEQTIRLAYGRPGVSRAWYQVQKGYFNSDVVR